MLVFDTVLPEIFAEQNISGGHNLCISEIIGASKFHERMVSMKIKRRES